MAKSSSASSAGRILAKRYAVALIDVAVQANALQAIENNIHSFENILTNHPELQAALASPVFSTANQVGVLQDIGGRNGFHPLMLNFLGVLSANRRLDSLPAIIQAFKSEMATRAGIVEAEIRTAHALSASQQETLARNLSGKTGKSVKLNVSVDPQLLGGMVVTIGSTMVDDSVQSKLTRLQHALAKPSDATKAA